MREVFIIFKENDMMLEQYILLVLIYVTIQTFGNNFQETKRQYFKKQILIETGHVVILILIAIIDVIAREYAILVNLSFFRWVLTLQVLFEIQKIILILPETKVTFLINKGIHRIIDILVNKKK